MDKQLVVDVSEIVTALQTINEALVVMIILMVLWLFFK